MSDLPYHLVNSFSSDSPTSGSQCAVVLLQPSDPRFKDDELLQAIAHNFNFPATSFLLPMTADGVELEYDLRWFATGELPFCGHGTLAAAQTLFALKPKAESITFNAKPGKLRAKRDGRSVQLSIPAIPIDSGEPDIAQVLEQISRVTSITPADVVNVVTFSWSNRGIIVEIKGDIDLAEATIDGRGLANIAASVVVFTQMLGEQDTALRIASRVFLPDAANVEDPVTGSAHAALTAYYSTHPSPLSRLPGDVNKAGEGFDITATQLSQRGGRMRIRYEDGRAVITAKATEWGKGTLPGV